MEYIVLAIFSSFFGCWLYAHIAFRQALKSYSDTEFQRHTGFSLGSSEFDKLSEYLYSKKYKSSGDQKLIKAGNRLLVLKQQFYVFWAVLFLAGIVVWCVSFVVGGAIA